MSADSKPVKLSHLTDRGEMRMVDVSNKDVTQREATASGVVSMRADTLDALLGDALPKRDALAAARLAGIMAAKRTAELIPLCHPLGLDWATIDFAPSDTPDSDGRRHLTISCTCRTTARTGVEMEALTGVTVAALTIYDMAKAVDRAMTIGSIQLEKKSGGKSGTYTRERG